MTGYRGTANYTIDCAAGAQSLDLFCDWRDLGNPRGMGRAFLNSLIVAILRQFCRFSLRRLPDTLSPGCIFRDAIGCLLFWSVCK